MDSPIHQISSKKTNLLHYPLDSDYPLDSVIHLLKNWGIALPTPRFKQLEPVLKALIISNFITFSCLFTAANMTAV